MRWFHEAVDRLHVTLLQRIIPPVFRHGIDSPSLSTHLAAVRLALPVLTATRHYSVLARTLIGEIAAGFQVRWGPQSGLPVIVYYHGIGEMPYDKSFRGIFRGSLAGKAHLVAVRAPFHRTWLDLLPGLGSMQHFLTMCAVAVHLGESVRQAMLAHGACGSMIVGTSLGGFLALVHHLAFGTADGYVPLLAGPDLAHVMHSTHYHRFLASQALAHPSTLQELLDLRQALQASDTRRVLPLLAQYDRDMLYDYHAACYAASGIPVVTIARGHITGALAFTALRAHVLACMQALLQKC